MRGSSTTRAVSAASTTSDVFTGRITLRTTGSERNLGPRRSGYSLKRPLAQRAAMPIPAVRCRGMPKIHDAVPLRVKELLTTWPQTVPEQIERAFCNVVRAHKEKRPGEALNVNRTKDCHIFFAGGADTLDYYINAMKTYEWVEVVRVDERSPDLVTLRVTPKGWTCFDGLERGRSNIRNPVFVAMWFGGKEHRTQMDELYEHVIARAINAAGYKAKRADADEHNEPIMDRVLEYIRRAPFVVAELSDENNGVYYEAGFAKGLGIEVIYCSRDKHIPHFDVTGINLVKWKDDADLLKRLENRVLGSQSRGPYDFSDVTQAFPPENGYPDDHR